MKVILLRDYTFFKMFSGAGRFFLNGLRKSRFSFKLSGSKLIVIILIQAKQALIQQLQRLFLELFGNKNRNIMPAAAIAHHPYRYA